MGLIDTVILDQFVSRRGGGLNDIMRELSPRPMAEMVEMNHILKIRLVTDSCRVPHVAEDGYKLMIMTFGTVLIFLILCDDDEIDE